MALLKLENLNYIYNPGTAMEKYALKEINLEIRSGDFIGIIGRTGSGKSTLIQHLNGLLKASSGEMYYAGENVYRKGYRMKELRRKVGLVFQYPEYQLFETEVIADVAFGPKNLGLSEAEAVIRAKEALYEVGVDEAQFRKSPFELSGGQKRRVAIAGVIAMRPEILVLDEPTAGLDPKGRDEILGEIRKLHDERGQTVVLVSHSMEDVAQYADRLIVMSEGRIVCDGSPREVFRQYRELEEIGLAAPQVTYLVHALRDKGLDIPEDLITVDEVVNWLNA